MKRFIAKYVVHPFKLLAANGSVFVAFFAVILANYVSNTPVPWNDLGHWSFDLLPSSLLQAVGTWRIALLIAGGFLLKTWLTVLVAKEMLQVYRHSRRGLFDTIRAITRWDMIWFILCETLTYFVFGMIALLFYVPSFFLYHHRGIDLSIALICIFAIAYPAFYICLSTGSMMAVLPSNSGVKTKLLLFLLSGRRFGALYLFYLVRIGIEFALLFAIPFVVLTFFKNFWLATLSSVAGLLVPFAVMRGSAYELKLTLLKDQSQIREIFKKHYEGA